MHDRAPAHTERTAANKTHTMRTSGAIMWREEDSAAGRSTQRNMRSSTCSRPSLCLSLPICVYACAERKILQKETKEDIKDWKAYHAELLQEARAKQSAQL